MSICKLLMFVVFLLHIVGFRINGDRMIDDKDGSVDGGVDEQVNFFFLARMNVVWIYSDFVLFLM